MYTTIIYIYTHTYLSIHLMSAAAEKRSQTPAATASLFWDSIAALWHKYCREGRNGMFCMIQGPRSKHCHCGTRLVPLCKVTKDLSNEPQHFY